MREALIEAARFLIAEKGPQGFTLIEAARLAEVSPAAPYRHFKDREQLVAAVAARGFEAFSDRLKNALSGSASPREGFVALGRAYLAFAREEPGYYGAMFLAVRTPGAPPSPDSDAFGYLLEAVRRLLTRDGATPVDPMPTAMRIWALAHGVATLAATGKWPAWPGVPSPEDVLAEGAGGILAAYPHP